MKILLPLLLGALISFTSSNLLLAQSENIQESTERTLPYSTANSELSVANGDNSDNDLSCYLMMNSVELKNLEKGAGTLRDELGAFGKKITPSQTPIAARASAYSSVGRTTISGQRSVEATAVSMIDETGEENSTTQLLKEEICNNIYLECIAKVATMSLAKRGTAEGISQEAKEWEAARHMAAEEERDCNNAWEEAKKETLAAQRKFDSANAIIHGKAYADEAYYDWQVKELVEKLAKARVTTAHETLNAIDLRETAQHARAESRLKSAIEIERKASDALEAATAHVSSEEVSPSSSTGKNFIRRESLDINQSSINLPAAPQRPLSYTPPKSPVPGVNIIGTEQNFAIPAIPIATAVEFNSVNKFTIAEPLNQLKLSEESTAKEKKAAVFESEFSTMIQAAKTQAEEAATAAIVTREKAEKQEASEKIWDNALGEAEIVERAYAQVIKICMEHQKHVADHYEGYIVETKGSKYNIELQKAENKKNHWTTEVKECKQKKEALQNEAIEKKRAAEAKVAQEREAARIAEQTRVEQEKKAAAEKERARIAEQTKIEMEKKIEADRIEAERAKKQAEEQAAAERAKQEAATKAKAEADRIEKERKETEQKAAEEKARIAEQTRVEQEKKAVAEKARLESEKKAEADRIEKTKKEAEQKVAEERARIAEQARVEQERQVAEEYAGLIARMAENMRLEREREAATAAVAPSSQVMERSVTRPGDNARPLFDDYPCVIKYPLKCICLLTSPACCCPLLCFSAFCEQSRPQDDQLFYRWIHALDDEAIPPVVIGRDIEQLRKLQKEARPLFADCPDAIRPPLKCICCLTSPACCYPMMIAGLYQHCYGCADSYTYTGDESHYDCVTYCDSEYEHPSICCCIGYYGSVTVFNRWLRALEDE